MVGPSENGSFELFDLHLLGLCNILSTKVLSTPQRRLTQLSLVQYSVQPSYVVILGKNEVKMSQVTWTCVRSVLVTGDAGMNPKSSVRETAPYAFNVSYNASNVMLKV